MNKVYVLTLTDKYSDDEIDFEIIGVYDNKKLAQEQLRILKKQDIEYYKDNGWEDLDIQCTANSVLFDFFDEYKKYEIVKKELNKEDK